MSDRNETGPTGTEELEKLFAKVLGYLNFSNGKPDSAILRMLNQVAAHAGCEKSWTPLRQAFQSHLERLKSSSPVFSDASQVEAVLPLVFDHVLPAYKQHHADLLFHLGEHDLQNAFFLGRVFEVTLAQGGPWDEVSRVVRGALDHLNDFLGYRPLAVLENGQKMAPYDHERTRPLPLYIAGAGTCASPYKAIVDQALELLKVAPREVLISATFDIAQLEELSLDVRAYDHDHPMFKRTNYLFGEWDPHLIDGKGFYRRFVVRKIIMDALVQWAVQQSDQVEAIFDTGAVLCGTMLMASAISGDGPASHDSTVTLTSLLPKVARQRDDFYTRLLETLTGPRAKRLLRESAKTQQPFGHVRQSLNLHLAHYGARQVQHRHLASSYARMGYSEAARYEASVIPCASARFETEIQWRLTSAKISVEKGLVAEANHFLKEIEELLHRGIHCGALVDPWNILGFQGNYPLFSAREDSIPDQRAETLLDLLERIFGVFSRVLTEAAAQGEKAITEEVTLRFEKLASYWDQFAAYVVDELPKVEGGESLESARHVAEALSEWRAAGEEAGNLAFWRKHVARFESPKAYACIIETLLTKGDHIAAMALLVQWLSCADEIGIESGPYSIHALLIDWMERLTSTREGIARKPVDWTSIRKLFDYLEVNAGDYWEVPALENFSDVPPPSSKNEWPSETPEGEWGEGDEDDEDNLFKAAYDDVVYKDSADDGQQSSLADTGGIPGNTEFEQLNRHLEPRIKFVMAMAQLWQISSGALAVEHFGDPANAKKGLSPERSEVVLNWWRRVRQLEKDLQGLMESIWNLRIDETSGDHDANVEFDIQLQTKFYLLNTIIAAHINCRIAEIGLLCLLPEVVAGSEVTDDDRNMIGFYRAVMLQDVTEVRRLLSSQFKRLSKKPLLYVPLDSGGHPQQILAARTVQADLRFLLKQLPRLGLYRETWHVVRLAHRMERETRPSQMSVTEFDRIFRTALRNTIDCLIESAGLWQSEHFTDEDLITMVGDVLSHYSDQWLKHSQTMRLSSVEGLRNENMWEDVQDFIETYGGELFHPKSLTLGNLRVILHNGVGWYLDQLRQQEDPLHPNQLLEAIEDGEIEEDDAIDFVELIYSAIVDRFDRFLEYNTTTTQSDYGDKFFVLLDFLRIEAAYDRQAWERIPESIVHRSLAMSSRPQALRMLEDFLEANSRSDADKHLAKLRELEQKYGVHLPSISDRLNERFIKPLSVNRMLALVEPAMVQAAQRAEKFERLRQEVITYMQDQVGSAVDVPQWLQDIEREVSRLEAPTDYIKPPELEIRLPIRHVTEEEVRNQLSVWGEAISSSDRPKKGTSRKRKDS